MKSQIYIIFLASLILFSCSNDNSKKEKVRNAFVQNKSSGNKIASIKNLSVIKTIDYVTFNGKKEYLSLDAIIKGYRHQVYIYDKYKIYITDLNLNVKKYINLKDKDFYIKGSVHDICIINDDIYILSSANTLIEIPNYNKENIKTIRLDIGRSKSIYSGDIIEICNVQDSELLATNGLLPFSYQPSIDYVELGRLFSLKGEFIRSFKFPKKDARNNFGKTLNHVFATNYNDLIYFSFDISRNICVYNMNGKLLNTYQLSVDKLYWHKPTMRSMSLDIANIKSGGTRFDFIPQSKNNLQIENNDIYTLMYEGKRKGPNLTVYNSNFVINNQLELKTIPSSLGYRIYVIDNRILISGRGLIYILE
jgi:hypothetical protein